MKFSNFIRKIRNLCPPDCHVCEEACAKKMGEMGPVIKANQIHESDVYKAITCLQCSEPECKDACPVDAIRKDEESGIVRVIAEACVGCESCIETCPYGNMLFSSNAKRAFKCDLCDGEPTCVAACPYKALEFFKGGNIQTYLGEDDFLSPGTRACAGCPGELVYRLTQRVLGKNTVFFGCPGCMTILMTGYETKAGSKLSYVSCLFTNVISTMTGISRYYHHIGKEANLVAFVGDGCLADIEFQALSAAAERREKMLVICYDNEGYQNTGNQMSSTTAFGARTTTSPVGGELRGKNHDSKYMPLIMVSHNTSYVATASPAYLEDYARKLTKAMNVKNGLSYIHVLIPCPTGWGFPMDKAIHISKLAVETNYFPLWEYEQGKLNLTHEISIRQPIGDYLKLMSRYRHLHEDELQQLQSFVDKRFARINSLASRTMENCNT